MAAGGDGTAPEEMREETPAPMPEEEPTVVAATPEDMPAGGDCESAVALVAGEPDLTTLVTAVEVCSCRYGVWNAHLQSPIKRP